MSLLLSDAGARRAVGNGADADSLAVLRKAIIPFEETCLDARFGADYADYRASVPRWF